MIPLHTVSTTRAAERACKSTARGTLRQGPPLRWGDAHTTETVFANHLELNAIVALIDAAESHFSEARANVWKIAMPGNPALGITPFFDELAADGLLFTRLFANGTHTHQEMTRFVGRDDYIDPVYSDPTWGVSDQDMFDRSVQELRALRHRGSWLCAAGSTD